MCSTQLLGKNSHNNKLLQHDVEEEDKVLHLCHHSKKLAIAFRLINKLTPPLLNTVIRCSSTEKVALEPPCRLDFLNSYCVWIGVVNSQFFRFRRLCSSTEFGLIDLLKNKNYSSKFLRNWIRGLIIKEKLMLDSITSSLFYPKRLSIWFSLSIEMLYLQLM
jgi:hypothetical protein